MYMHFINFSFERNKCLPLPTLADSIKGKRLTCLPINPHRILQGLCIQIKNHKPCMRKHEKGITLKIEFIKVCWC